MDKFEMFENGLQLLLRFGELNNIELPTVRPWPGNRIWRHGKICAYYLPPEIVICLYRCAHIGKSGAAWSYPGYVIDRTPYGVLGHELGHHVDHLLTHSGMYQENYSTHLMKSTGESKLTNYAPHPAEWFAEMFRLFCTNSELLRYLRPKTYAALREQFDPPEKRSWATVLIGAPRRTVLMASKKIWMVRELS